MSFQYVYIDKYLGVVSQPGTPIQTVQWFIQFPYSNSHGMDYDHDAMGIIRMSEISRARRRVPRR